MFSVNQAAAPCTFVLTPDHRVHGYEGETATVNITTLSTCDWEALNTNSWMDIKIITNGTGSDTVRYAVFRNPNPVPRTCVFTIGGQPFTVIQQAAPCEYFVAPSEATYGAQGGSGNFRVLSSPECGWTIVNPNHWITLHSPTTGAGDAGVDYTVAPSLDRNLRTGVVLVNGQPFTVTQLGSTCYATTTPGSRTHGYGDMTGTVNVSLHGTCSGIVWHVVATNDWITFTSGTNGTGNGTVSYVLERNPTGVPRTTFIEIADQPFALTQLGANCSYTLSPTQRSHGAGIENGSIAVTTSSDCAWDVVNTNAWITLASSPGGTGSGTVNYTVNANPGPARTGTLVIGGLRFTVNQASGLRLVRAGDIQLTSGEPNWLPVLLEARGGENELGFSLCFDPLLVSFAGVRLGETANASLIVDTTQAAVGRVGVTWALPDGLALSAGTYIVVEVAFQGQPVVRTETVTVAMCDQPTRRALFSGNNELFAAEYVGGTAQVIRECFLGDALDAPDLEWTSDGRAPPWQCETDVTLDGIEAAQTTVVGDSQYAFIKTTVVGPVQVSFWWKVSSEADHDWLRFMLDAEDQFRISGEVDWEWRTFDVPAGEHELQWRYSKNSNSHAGQDRAWVDQVRRGPPPPIVLSQPANQTAELGATRTFTVVAAGAGPLSYQWQWNGMDLADSSSVSGATTATLRLTDVQSAQAGLYSVRVTNSAGSVVSSSALLTVNAASLLAEAVDAPGHVFTTGGDAVWFNQTSTTFDQQDAAESGDIGNRDAVWLETTVAGPDTVSFWWKVSSEQTDDPLIFTVNGSEQARISGEVDWQWRSFDLGSGNQVLRWTYSKDRSTSRGQDRGWVDRIQFGPPMPTIIRQPAGQTVVVGTTVTLTALASGATPLSYQWQYDGEDLANFGNVSGATTPTLRITNAQREQSGVYILRVNNALGSVVSSNATVMVLTLPDAVNAPHLTWTTGGSAPWFPEGEVTHDGLHAVASGPTGPTQSSWLETTVLGSGVVRFWWKVSSETNGDWLRFYVDDVEWANLSGEVDWQQPTFGLPAGNHVLRWIYSKDYLGVKGQDRGWLDEFQFVPGTGPIPPKITLQPVSQDVAPGATVTFETKAIGTTPMSHQWRFNGQNLADGAMVMGATSPRLTLLNVGAANEGDYTVVVQNDYSLDVSASARLQVIPVISIPEAVDDPYGPWTLGGAAPWFGQAAVTHDWRDAAESPELANGATAWMKTTVTGPGSVSFWWKVSSQSGRDYLQFLVDGVAQANLSGEVDWNWRTFDYWEGTHVFQWAYTKDSSGSSGQDRGWVDAVHFGSTAPKVSGHPDSLTADTGANVTFHASVTNTPIVQNQWRFNGVNLTNSATIGGVTSSKLILTNVQPAQSGAYSAIAENDGGRAISSNAVLTVLTGSPFADALETTGWGTPSNSVWSSGWITKGDSIWTVQTSTTHDGVDAAQSGPIPPTGETLLQTTIAGPGRISFWWSVSSQATNDQLRFYVGNVMRASIYGNVSWQQATIDIPLGLQLLEWRYRKDLLLTSGQDRGWLDQVSYVPTIPPTITQQPASQSVEEGETVTFSVHATGTSPFSYQWRRNGVNLSNGGSVSGATTATLRLANVTPAQAGTYSLTVSNAAALVVSSNAVLTIFPLVPLAEALDALDWNWSVSGSPTWVGQTQVTHDGVDAARSGSIGNSRDTRFQATVVGPGTLSWWWKVSSEPNNDRLRFYLDGSSPTEISGEVDWVPRTFNIPAGSHTVQWRYSKNGSRTAGQDRAWVDEVQFAPQLPAITGQPQNTTVDEGATVTFSVQANGTPPLNYLWRRNGLTLGDVGSVSGSHTPTLRLANVQAADAGLYSVQVVNAVGSVLSADVRLTVIRLLPLAEAVDTPGWEWAGAGDASWVGQPTVSHDGEDAARSGAIVDGQNTRLETHVTGPGTVSFWWKVSSEPDNDQLRFYIGDVEQVRISGEVDWEYRTYEVPVGDQLLKWRYSKNNRTTGGQDRAWVDQIQFFFTGNPVAPEITSPPVTQIAGEGDTVNFDVGVTGSAPLSFHWQFDGTNLVDGTNVSGATTARLVLVNVQPFQAGTYSVLISNEVGSVTSPAAQLTLLTLGEAVDAPSIHWQMAGFASWIAETDVMHDGMDAARSGVIGPGENTRLETFIMGPGTVSFWWRVSSEPDKDQLRFYVGSTEQIRISGEVDWEFQTFPVPAGVQLLKWRYSKNDQITAGLDRGWVDQIQYVPDQQGLPMDTNQTPPAVRITVAAGGLVSLRWDAAPGRVYRVEYTVDLAQPAWTAAGGDVTATDLTAQATEQVSPSGQRFYRVRLVE